MLEDVDRRTRRGAAMKSHDGPRDTAGDHPAEPRDRAARPARATTCSCTPGRTTTTGCSGRLLPGAGRRGAGRLPGGPRARLRRPGRRRSSQRIEDCCSESSGPIDCCVLGDTNSGLAAIVARRLRHPGLPHGGRQPLLRRPRARGGEPPRHRSLQHRADALHRAEPGEPACARGSKRERIFVTGNPICEVIEHYERRIAQSRVRNKLGVDTGEYFLVTMHRAENVDAPAAAAVLLSRAVGWSQSDYGLPVIVSVHPRTATEIAAIRPRRPTSSLVTSRRAARLLRLRRARTAGASAS